MNLTRIYAIFLRHFFLSIHQIDRLFSVFYFPILSLILWGFISRYVGQIQSNLLAAFLVGGLILWTIFESVDTDIGVSFMFDVWERNIVNVFSSPITVAEYLVAFLTSGLVKILISLVLMTTLAAVFYGFNIANFGIGLPLFWINLVIFGWTFGVFNLSLVLRLGSRLGPLTWSLPFLLQPVSAVFYPVSVLPEFLQKMSFFIPISHVFEGARYTLKTGQFDMGQFVIAMILNLIYLAASVLFFSVTFKAVKKNGQFVKLI